MPKKRFSDLFDQKFVCGPNFLSKEGLDSVLGALWKINLVDVKKGQQKHRKI